MEEEIESPGGSVMLPIALAGLAIVLGGAGLYFGLSANQQLSPLSASLNEGSSSAARLEKEVGALEGQLEELRAENVELRKSLERSRIYSTQSERAVKQLASSVKENREQLVKQAERLNELATARRRPGSAAARPDSGASAAEEAGADTAPEGSYTIRSGDTFGKIAEKTGVTLQALLDANPDADPRRLRIGQVIQLPER
ncbi:MAG: LysM peptidoglycan-binding domain-containing protein [Opitutales bacterium]